MRRGARRTVAGSGVAFALACFVARPPAAQQGPKQVADHVPHQLLVRLDPGAGQSALKTVLDETLGTVLHAYHLVPDLYLIETVLRAETARDRVLLLPPGDVLYVRLNYRLRPTGWPAGPGAPASPAPTDPSDPYFEKQWGLHTDGGTLELEGNEYEVLEDADIDAPEAWLWFTPSGSFPIALIDTGVDVDHEDLGANFWRNDDDGGVGWDFTTDAGVIADGSNHGTRVAGIIGAVGDNDKGVAGILWDCDLMVLRCFTYSSLGSTSDVAMVTEALEYAIDRGVRLSNNSYGADWLSEDDMVSLHEAIEFAASHDHLYVTAAGNGGDDLDDSPFYPACFEGLDNMLVVTSTDHRDEWETNANYSPTFVHLAAPGYLIQSTSDYGMYGVATGTSFSCAMVTGVAAAVWDKYPSWTYAEVKERLLESVREVDGLDEVCQTGGVVNLRSALNWFTLVIPEDMASWFEHIEKIFGSSKWSPFP